MPYDKSKLTPNDTTSLDWAVAWTRFLLHDTNDDHETYADDEITAVLTSLAWEHETVTYYRPHLAAASLIESDPDRALSESTLGASITNRDPRSIARSIRKGDAWVRAFITAATDGYAPDAANTLEVTW